MTAVVELALSLAQLGDAGLAASVAASVAGAKIAGLDAVVFAGSPQKPCLPVGQAAGLAEKPAVDATPVQSSLLADPRQLVPGLEDVMQCTVHHSEPEPEPGPVPGPVPESEPVHTDVASVLVVVGFVEDAAPLIAAVGSWHAEEYCVAVLWASALAFAGPVAVGKVAGPVAWVAPVAATVLPAAIGFGCRLVSEHVVDASEAVLTQWQRLS